MDAMTLPMVPPLSCVERTDPAAAANSSRQSASSQNRWLERIRAGLICLDSKREFDGQTTASMRHDGASPGGGVMSAKPASALLLIPAAATLVGFEGV
jgi:hypothetical protein